MNIHYMIVDPNDDDDDDDGRQSLHNINIYIYWYLTKKYSATSVYTHYNVWIKRKLYYQTIIFIIYFPIE